MARQLASSAVTDQMVESGRLGPIAVDAGISPPLWHRVGGGTYATCGARQLGLLDCAGYIVDLLDDRN